MSMTMSQKILADKCGLPRVEPNQLIVGHGRVPVLRFPYRAYLHAPVVSVAAGLRQRHVGEVGGEGPR